MIIITNETIKTNHIPNSYKNYKVFGNKFKLCARHEENCEALIKGYKTTFD